jgi:hypothetical protein
VIARVCAYWDLKRELIRGYVEGKTAPADTPGRLGTMQWYYQAVASLVGVRLQANQIKAIDAWAAARGHPPRGHPRHDRRDAAHPRERPGREAGQEGENPMKESTLAKITASVSVAKGMAQKALAASPNPQWTEYEMQSVDEWIAR